MPWATPKSSLHAFRKEEKKKEKEKKKKKGQGQGAGLIPDRIRIDRTQQLYLAR